jgi:hypothetical protein
MTEADNHIAVTLPISGERSLRVVWSEKSGLDVCYVVPTDEANGNASARRIVAAVNATAGIPTATLEAIAKLRGARRRILQEAVALGNGGVQ